ncbi:MAG: SMC-Scp complex subunit ScpB [Acidobacteria bacterium]|nr:SMC-Scp complex subunit ScpB [Acidobacteriota bacterium]
MSIKSQVEAIIYAAEEPVTIEQISVLLREANAAAEPACAPPEADVPEGESQPRLEVVPSLKAEIRRAVDELIAESASPDRGIEVRAIAGGYRMATKPEHHEVVRAFARSLIPPVRLSFPALETLAVIAYKQPVTVPEISEIRGVDSSGVIGTLLDRKLITTAGRKQVIGRPILYKTTREFLMRFGLKDLSELPSVEEFEKLMSEAAQQELLPPHSPAPAGSDIDAARPAAPSEEHCAAPAASAASD